MGFLSNIDRHIRGETDPAFHDRYYTNWDDVPDESYAGIDISPQTSMRISTVWKCVNWRARMVAQPWKVWERVTRMERSSQIEATDHHLFPLIHTAPNPTMTSAAWFGLISKDLHLHGNSYAYIQRDERARIRALWRLAPEFVTPEIKRDPTGKKQLWYMVRGDNGKPEKFYPDEILHIRHTVGDGIRGYSAIEYQMNLLGWNKAAVRYSAQFFRHAARPSGLVSLTNGVKPEKKPEIIEALRASGREAGKLVLIEGAATFTKMTMDQDEAQFLETIQAQEDDIAGIMEVKPHEIGIMRHATNNNIEQETISSVTRCLAPFAVNVEQWLNLQLFSDAPSTGIGGGTERDRYFIQCNLRALLRGDTAAQTALLIAMRDRGIYDGNDCADYLGMAPFEGGDIRVINAAYVPLDMLREISTKQTPSTSGVPDTPGAPKQDSQASIASAFSHIFHAGVIRTTERKKDRDKLLASIFRPALFSIGELLAVKMDGSFVDDYLASMAQRAAAWEESKADAITDEELRRAVTAMLERGN